uniref:NADH-plastoquinone oxidoreductase subunit 6 n=1 Tax=Pallavicinia lyellii TaxID=56939 RepID=UPI001D0FB9A5|nr:NADH-plastoquinone oxidoreductase subunit 6 [Pallavicinia lyellii]QZZ24693.1 NADH-plastoquinone oxidoreductase subunit 6 [Pallavicinia lyellii]QZZ24777.1 NADH-plastoquinone oxidoreductase subunit 6 [Pallavicinia lyellii]
MKLPESFYEIIFSFLELSLILGSLGVVLLGNTVYSAFLLGFVFVGISLLYLLLGADFVAAAQILIYVGAVNVLIVFAVTLMNKKQSQNLFLYWTIGDGIASVTCTGIFISLGNAISNTSWSKIRLFTQSNSNRESIIIAADNTRRIGLELLTEFLIPFELMSIILLVALIGAIAPARKDRIADTENKVLRNESESNL